MEMRLRLPELLEEHNTTAYEIAAKSDGRINASQLYRLVRKRGKVDLFSASLLEALCDVLKVKVGDLFERDGEKPPRRK